MIRLLALLFLTLGCAEEAQRPKIIYEDLLEEKPSSDKVAEISTRGLEARINRNELEIRYMESLLKRDSLENIVEKQLTKKN